MLRHGGGGCLSTALHRHDLLPNSIQCLGSDDIMSLGIKSFATESVHDKVHDKVHDW